LAVVAAVALLIQQYLVGVVLAVEVLELAQALL
jgi:hypothetical protein